MQLPRRVLIVDDDDALGRLIGVVDPGSDSVRYNYDAVGNLLSIERQASSGAWIIGFLPGRGPVGTSVAMSGSGFSTTAGNNTVKFNGTTATVTLATATQLVATVPSGATTGTISVTVSGTTVTSSTTFTVASDAPTLTSFTPTVADRGATVTITGTNYDTVFPNNRVKFYLARSDVTASTSTTVSAVVPATATSGRLTATTPFGSVVSTQDFFVPPTTAHVAAEVVATGRITIGGASTTLTMPNPDKLALLVFEGTAGQPSVFLDAYNVSLPSVSIAIYKPDGGVWLNPTGVGTAGALIDLGTLPATGTYTLRAANPSYTGNVTLKLGDRPDLVPTALSVTGSVTRNANNTYTIPLSWTVQNQGQTKTTGNYYDKVYLSSNATWESGDAQLTSVLRAGGDAVLSGARYTQPATVTTGVVTPGNYDLILITDQTGTQTETSETNNTMVTAVTLPGPVDLVPTALTIPSGPVARNGNGTYTLPISWTAKNQGGDTAQPSWYDRAYLSSDTTWDGSDPQINITLHSTSLAPQATYDVSVTPTPGVSRTAGC